MWVVADCGGTHWRLAMFRGNGRIESEPVQLGEPLEFLVTQGESADFDTDFKNLKAGIWHLIRDRKHGVPDKIVFAVAGEVDQQRRALDSAGNLLHLVDMPIVDLLEAEFPGIPVYLGNDTEAAALAEAVHGSGQGKKFRLVGWGTGLGSCAISRCVCGGLLTHPGEFGHQRVTNNLRLCGCGKRGCVEAEAGGASLREIHGVPLDELSREQWLTAAEHVVTALHNTVVTDGVELVVFTGGVICKQQWLTRVMQQMLHGAMRGRNVPELCISHFGESAGLVGAYVLGAWIDKQREHTQIHLG
jgi:glucokinase